MTDKTLSYKEYCGSVDFSIDDDCLYGKILFINDLVTYEAETLTSLRVAFKDAVDFYLDKCTKEGLIADKPFSGTFNVRFGKDLHRAAAIAAAKKGLFLNDFVRDCVEHCLSEKATLVNHTENHTHYHQTVDLGEFDKYEEDATSLWTAKAQNGQKQKELH